ncbi:MAG: hypothetical protein GQ527_04605, partial [Bacteroidales bacterium]|nr:hypothetical protein [Bacteroidales bacterium]
MKKGNYFLFFLLFLLSSTLFGQTNSSFYEHYTGLISSELKLTADLIKLEDSFSGYYYYEFKEDGAWQSSKPIALDGRVDKGDAFVLNEFGENQSFFQGNLDNPKLITGHWHNPFLKDAVSFTLKATYSQGTIAMRLVESKEVRSFNNNKLMPEASFYISVLFPSSNMDQVVYHQLLKKIY